MQPAIVSIVDTYVRFGNRQALQEMWRLRSNLRVRVLALDGGPFDPGKIIARYNEEMTVIEAGLARLTPAIAA
jgi:hypothetical protein